MSKLLYKRGAVYRLSPSFRVVYDLSKIADGTMLVISEYEQVTQIIMSSFPEVRTGTSVAAYLVEGLLIDSGLAHTANELADFLKD